MPGDRIPVGDHGNLDITITEAGIISGTCDEATLETGTVSGTISSGGNTHMDLVFTVNGHSFGKPLYGTLRLQGSSVTGTLMRWAGDISYPFEVDLQAH